MATVQSVVKRIAAELDDPTQKWAREPFVRPFLNGAMEDLYAKMAEFNIAWPQRVDELLNVAANTTNLNAYQAAGAALQDMVQIVYLEWKPAGAPATEYAEVKRRDRLPDVQPGPGVPYFEERGGGVYLTASTVAVDLRVRSEVMPAEINDLGDPIMAAMRSALVYMTAFAIASVRGIDSLIARLQTEKEEAVDTLENRLIKRRQRVPLRIGSQRRPQRRVVQITL